MLNCTWTDSIYISRGVEKFHLQVEGPDNICPNLVYAIYPRTEYEKYHWNTGDTTSTLIVSKTGIYRLVVEDSFGCQGEGQKVVISYPDNSFKIKGDSIICQGETVMLSISPGYETYRWDDGQSSRTRQVTGTGRYCATVTDVNGCQWEDCLQLKERPLSRIKIDTTICPGTFLVYGHFYLRDSGIHQISLKNKYGCDSIFDIRLRHAELPNVDSAIIDADFGQGGRISLRISGGKQPLKVLWDHGDNGSQTRYLPFGRYRVRIIDAMGCMVRDSFYIPLRSSVNNKSDGEIRIWPNTLQTGNWEGVWVEGLTKGKYHYKLYSVNGQLVYRKRRSYYSEGPIFLTLPDQRPGYYLLVILSERGRAYTRPIIIL